MKMRRFVTLLLGLCMISAFFSCQNQRKVKVGFLFSNTSIDRYVKERQYFTAKIQELGGEALTASAENNDQLQIQQGADLIKQGVKVLIVNSVNLNTAAAIVRNAQDKGVVVIAYDRLIGNCDLDYYLSFDNEKVGKLMGDYVTKLKPNGNYVLLGGDKADQNAIWVKSGQKAALSSYLTSGSIKIVYDTYIEDWSGSNARAEMEKYLNLSESVPDVVLSSYDGMSTGVIDLLKERNLAEKVLITGQDAELEACRNIVKGYQTMTVYKSVKKLAEKAADLSMKLAKNEKITEISKTVNNGQKEVPAVLLDPVAVDKNNLKSTVIAEGFQTESAVYNQ